MFIFLHLKSTENLEIKPLENTKASHCVPSLHHSEPRPALHILGSGDTRVYFKNWPTFRDSSGEDLQGQVALVAAAGTKAARRPARGLQERSSHHPGGAPSFGKSTKVPRSRWGPWPRPGPDHQSTVLIETSRENDFQRCPFIIMEGDRIKVSFTNVGLVWIRWTPNNGFQNSEICSQKVCAGLGIRKWCFWRRESRMNESALCPPRATCYHRFLSNTKTIFLRLRKREHVCPECTKNVMVSHSGRRREPSCAGNLAIT